MRLLIDKPIEKIEEDKLGRSEFAHSFSKMLLTSENEDGMVILLNGKWGSGKTSVVNLIKKYITTEISTNENIEYVPIVHDFSPWNVVSQDDIISQFFDTLSSGFKITKIKNALKSIKNSKVFQNTFKTLKYIPLISNNSAWRAINVLKKKFDNYVKSFNENKNLLERKNEIVCTLEMSFTRHIVFIDDLDRLNDSEIKLVIQLVKSVCNFPNVIYVLSADANIIQSALRNEQSFNAEGDKYLEKIIHVTFDIPNAKSDKIMEITLGDLDSIFYNKLTESDVQRFQSYYSCGLLKSIQTIRDEKRFINLLNVTYDVYKGELDFSDFIAVSYLKFINPQIIQLLCDYSDHLLGKYYDGSENIENLENKFKTELLAINSDDSLYLIIKKMFPQMFSQYYIDNKELYLSKRICSRNRFNLFLTLQLDTDDLSIVRFRNAIESRKYNDLLEFSKTLSPQQGRKFLLHLVNFVRLSSTIEECDFIVEFLLKDLSDLQVQDETFLVSKGYYVRDFIKELCKKYNPSETYTLISKHINESGDLYSLSELAIELNLKDSSEKHKYGFSEEETKKITSDVCDILMKRIKNNDLKLPRKARGIRLIFEQNKKKLKEHFTSLNEEMKANFLCDMIWIGSMTDTKFHLTYCYSIDWINYLLSKQELGNLIKNTFNNLSDCNKQRILILKMQLSDFKSEHFLSDKSYLVEDINRYCKENKISFTASDKLEEKKTK